MKLSNLLAVALGITLVALAPASAERQPFVTFGHPTLEAINDAYLSGSIDENQALLYRLFFVKAPERLPADLRVEGVESDVTIRCATPILVEVYERSETFPADLRAQVEDTRARPYGLNQTITTTHYIVHYTTTGGDACNQAYAQTVADACELTWTTLHTQMGWDVPPGDGGLGGGTNMIDCYIHSLGSGILGQAEPESPVPTTPEPNDYTGFFHISNTISNLGWRQSTVSHENMHVVQFGYFGGAAHRWFDENCAMIAQEWVYDNVNDYIDYLGYWFSSPFKSLKTFNGGYEYGGIVWPMYMSERFEPDMVRLAYDGVQWTCNIWTTYDNLFPTYGTTLTDAYMELMRWCWYTRTRDDGNHLSEAGLFMAMLSGDWTYYTYPTGELHPRTGMLPEALGTSIKKFQRDPASSDNLLVIDYNGPVCGGGFDFLVKQNGASVYYEYYMTLDSNGDGHLEVPNWDAMEYGMTMAHMKRTCTSAQDYVLEVSTTTGFSNVPEMGPFVRVYPNAPNPFATYTMISYALSEAGDVEIQVVDANGRLVRNLFSGRQYVGDYQIAWDGQDNAGRPVTNGMYYARVLSGDQQAVREMALVR